PRHDHQPGDPDARRALFGRRSHRRGRAPEVHPEPPGPRHRRPADRSQRPGNSSDRGSRVYNQRRQSFRGRPSGQGRRRSAGAPDLPRRGLPLVAMSTGRELRILALVFGLVAVLVSTFLRKGERIKGVAFFVAWLVPGAGHFLLGKWKKGLFFFLLL